MEGQTTITLFPRHREYLKKLKKQTRQGASDTIRRALDDYMASHPLFNTEKGGGVEVSSGREAEEAE